MNIVILKLLYLQFRRNMIQSEGADSQNLSIKFNQIMEEMAQQYKYFVQVCTFPFQYSLRVNMDIILIYFKSIFCDHDVTDAKNQTGQ